MKVLWISKGMGAGGAEALLLETARVIKDEDLKVDYAFAVKSPGWADVVQKLNSCGIQTHYLGSQSSRGLLWIWTLRKLLKIENYDVIHSHSPLPAVAVRVLTFSCLSKNRPALVSTEHNLWHRYHRLTRLASRITRRRDALTFAVSHAVKESNPRRFRQRIDVVYQGIAVSEVSKWQSARSEVRGELDIKEGEVLVGSVSSMSTEKNLPLMLEAAKRVKECQPNVRFVHMGDGPERYHLLALANEFSLGDSWRFLGYRSDARRLMAGLDMLAFSSNYEGLPVAAMEACALGLPIVATDVGGLREIVNHGKGGILVEPKASEPLAAAIVALARDEPRRRAMRVHSRQCAQRFAIEKAAAKLIHSYRAIATTP